MKKLRAITARVHGWNRIFCASLTCGKNLKRDALIVLAVIGLLATSIWMDYYLYDKKIQAIESAGLQIMKTSSEYDAPEQIETAKQDTLEQAMPPQNDEDTPAVVETEKPKPKPVAVAPKKIIRETKSTGISCIKIPANILATLKGAPTPPDGKMKNGKLICHILAEGKKDDPHKSDKNPKGEWGGCCYDPDEVPNPNCCYPVGSVYEKPLNNYFKHPFPLRK